VGYGRLGSNTNMGDDMTDPYYSDDAVTIYHGDCIEIMPELDFDVIVSDPPYGINYEGYNHGKVAGDHDTEAVAAMIAAAHGTPAVLTGANHFAYLLPTVGAWSCWDKRTSESADRMFGSPFELIWASGDDRAGKMYRIMHGGLVNADAANIKRVHPTQKPVTLMCRLLADWAADGVILDPFMGSGTTLRAAKDLGRKAIGIEIEEKYCEIAAKRMAQGVLDFGATE
jgi:site-specific DNA-methyltransferase (adenine-specific)